MLRAAFAWVLVLAGIASARVAHADPAPPPNPLWQRLELEFPLLRPLRFSFNAAPVAGYEQLALPTFRSESVWWQRGALSLQTFSQQAPAFELDCSVTCQPMLERTLGVEGRLELGGLGRAAPATNLYVRAQSSQVFPSAAGTGRPRTFSLLSAGFGGLLDF
ncbi:MAG: hypothetical protein QM756_17375 [Polyangiaceae bacterium]